MVISVPARFTGTDAEREANRASHHFATAFDGDCTRCWDCDCRAGSVSADWACGADVPREVFER